MDAHTLTSPWQIARRCNLPAFSHSIRKSPLVALTMKTRRRENSIPSPGLKPKPPRCAKVSGRLAVPKIAKVLKVWFLEESITYREARARLIKRFGVRASLTHLCRFWQRHCRQPAEAEALPSPLLDVVIECSRPVRLKILRRQAGIQITTTPTPTPTAAVRRKGPRL